MKTSESVGQARGTTKGSTMNSEKKQDIRAAVFLTALLTAALLAAPAMAEEVNLSGDAPADGVVMIENIAGSITVIGWDKNEITVTGTMSDEVEKIDFTTGKKSRIKVVYPKKTKTIKTGADLEIHVPKGSSVEIECISAPIDVSGLTATVEAASISGNVTITGVCEEIEAESISGDVIIEGGAPEIEIGSISGEVSASGGTSEVEAETVSGDIALEFKEYLGLSVGSVAGSAKIKGALADEASISVDLHSGNLTMIVPGSVSADFEIETFSGDIDNDFGQKAHKTSEYSPGKELEFSVGSGSARVRISTFSGDVEILKK